MKGIGGSEEAIQNIVSDYSVPWEFKKITVAPKYLDMAKRIWDRYTELYKKDMFAVRSAARPSIRRDNTSRPWSRPALQTRMS